jgi:GT2 family glycosyltransferase
VISPTNGRAEPEPRSSVAAIVVTHNRLALLQECVAALRSQSRPVDEIIVVNNGCTDGTADWLAAQSDLTVVTQDNLGSSGGQYTGIKTAYQHGHDWFWCMDDDTIPESDALQAFARSPGFTSERTGFLSSVVLWTDGTIHRFNLQPIPDPTRWMDVVLRNRQIPQEVATFVGVLVARRAVAAVGLPLKELFLWTDDVEFTRRISLRFDGFLVLDSRVVHKTRTNQDGRVELNAADTVKHCYYIRNTVALMRRDRPSRLSAVRGLFRLFLGQAYRVITRQKSVKTLWWFAKGLVFNPRVEYVATTPLSQDEPTSTGAAKVSVATR